MKQMLKYLATLTLFLSLGACLSSATTTGGTDSGNPTVESGLASFTDGDIEEAEDTFCGGLDTDATDSELAFGCFFSKVLLLPEGGTGDTISESSDADTLLASFSEDPFNLNASLLDDGGLFDLSNEIVAGGHFPLFNYSHFNLPFASTLASTSGLQDFLGTILQNAIDNGVTASDLVTQLAAFSDDYEEMETLLDIVLDDSDFTFTLPAELFHADSDVVVTLNDARLMQAGIEQAIVGLAVLQAYDFGMTIDDFVTAGVIDEEILVEDLNGSGATVNTVTVDTTAFMTLLDGSLITEQEDRFTASLALLETGLQALADGETSQFFTSTLGNVSRELLFTQELQTSLTTPTEMTSLHTAAPVTLDMAAFFANPPDASTVDVSAGDPFVFEIPSGATEAVISPVESYFQAFLDGIVEF